jgi:hypothetical protein
VSKYVIVDTDVFSYLWQGRPERDRMVLLGYLANAS